MNFELADKLDNLLQKDKIEEAIDFAETELKKLPITDFHKILNNDLLHLKSDLSNCLTSFYNSASKFYIGKKGLLSSIFKKKNTSHEKELKAIYSELNGFTINYDRWFVNFFAYSFYNGIEELDWLAEFEYDTEKSLTITGFEELQTAFQDYIKNEKWNDEELKKSMEICELLVIIRLQQLYKQTFTEGKDKGLEWTTIPIIVTAHDYDMIYQIKE